MDIKITLTASPDLLAALQGIAAALTTKQVATQTPTTQTATVPVDEPKPEKPKAKRLEPAATPNDDLTIEAVRAAAQKVAQGGKKDEVKALLAELGISKVTDLVPDQYGLFLDKLATV